VLAPAWIEFEGAAQVAQLRRTVTKNGKKTVDFAGSLAARSSSMTTRNVFCVHDTTTRIQP
jgi:hypothetical protein